jgi:hypothetical protein
MSPACLRYRQQRITWLRNTAHTWLSCCHATMSHLHAQLITLQIGIGYGPMVHIQNNQFIPSFNFKLMIIYHYFNILQKNKYMETPIVQEFCLLLCNVMWVFENQLTFRRSTSPPSAGLRNKTNKKPTWSIQQTNIVLWHTLKFKSCLLSASVWFLAWLKWRHVLAKRQLIFNRLHGCENLESHKLAVAQSAQKFITIYGISWYLPCDLRTSQRWL